MVEILTKKMELELTIGKDGKEETVTLSCLCPRCESDDLICNGHDMNVQGNPQHLVCTRCGKRFYPHTSYHAKVFALALVAFLGQLLDKGRISVQRLKAAMKSPSSTASSVMARIVKAVNASPRTKAFWAEPVEGLALFIDETFIKIRKKTWYLIVILNEAGRVLHYDVVRHRTADVILEMLLKVSLRLLQPFTHLITDGYTAYVKVAKIIGRDLIHVQCIHKPPYKRVIINQITHEADRIIIKTLATMDDILKNTNAFIAQESTKIERKIKEKRGRPKGVKNGQGKKHQQSKAKKNEGMTSGQSHIGTGRRASSSTMPLQEP
jgi:hypothetical protein